MSTDGIQIKKMSHLKKEIKKIIEDEKTTYPQEIFYHEGFEHTKYKITIEVIAQDYFIDSKGVKWIREIK